MIRDLKVKLSRKWKLRNLDGWETGLLSRYIDENRCIRGTSIRDIEIVEAARAGRLREYSEGLSLLQMEAAVISVNGHLKPGEVSLRSHHD